LSLKLAPQIILPIALAGIAGVVFADGWDPTSDATNTGSIANTRHNLTVDFSPSQSFMNLGRNDYGAICVYCHTPHGANKQIGAPLWNRTVNPGQYTIYDKPTTLNLAGRMSLPGPGSLTCLSCHDGTIAIDSVLNMPGSGLSPTGIDQNAETGLSNMNFLDQWTAAGNGNQGPSGNHFTLGGELGTGSQNTACAFCHNGQLAAAPDYRAFMLGTDLRNDHVIGIKFPTTFGPGIDFNKPDITIPNRWSFYDTNSNGLAEKNEVRLYDSGEGPEVECASCHDPHGIPSNGPGTKFNPSFLRVNNGIADNGTSGTSGILSAGPSALCLTCHAK
jgi:cytochrome c5